MIKINGHEVLLDSFGDGTLKCDCLRQETVVPQAQDSHVNILWCYDNDSELFALRCIVDYIKSRYPFVVCELTMPYIPNARQDRYVSDRIFTLKSFANIINQMGFAAVFVYDPHSDVSPALIDRCFPIQSAFEFTVDKDTVMMYPDTGAAKKYGSGDSSAIIGNKHRNAEGRIDAYELINFTPGTKKVVIRDDICSYGGTFAAAARELRRRGVEEIVLVVTHCENNIFKGEVLDYVDAVFTTDSIFTGRHPQVHIARHFRA